MLFLRKQKSFNWPHFERYSEGYFETWIFCQPFIQWTLLGHIENVGTYYLKLSWSCSNETSIFCGDYMAPCLHIAYTQQASSQF